MADLAPPDANGTASNAQAFAQLTWRESLRDIEVSLSANAPKLYAMGFRSPLKRSTLADANDSRDWRIWFDLAAVSKVSVRRRTDLPSTPTTHSCPPEQ